MWQNDWVVLNKDYRINQNYTTKEGGLTMTALFIIISCTLYLFKQEEDISEIMLRDFERGGQ